MDNNNWHLSDKLTVSTTSYIVKNLVPNVPYTFQVLFAPIYLCLHHVSIECKILVLLKTHINQMINQVIAAEDKGSFFGIEYNRGPQASFVIKTRQKQVGFSTFAVGPLWSRNSKHSANMVQKSNFFSKNLNLAI